MTKEKESRFTPFLSNLHLFHQGKTRDTFEIGDEKLLVVATDRISTHNVVHKSEIPFKGDVLTALTIFWVREILDKESIPHHLKSFGKEVFKFLPGKSSDYPKNLAKRAIIVEKLSMIPIEFIYRNYLMGSLYNDYRARKDFYRLRLPKKLPLMYKFERPVFTPTNKSDEDEPLNSDMIRQWLFEEYDLGLKVFTLIGEYLSKSGLDLCDSKLEMGLDNSGHICVGDEIVTPDSSRFSYTKDIVEGQNPPHLDKQVARDTAEKIWGKDGTKSPIKFDDGKVTEISRTYIDIFEKITGKSLSKFQKEDMGV